MCSHTNIERDFNAESSHKPIRESDMNLLNFDIYTGNLQDVFYPMRGQCIINTINPHSYIVSLKDCSFHDALIGSNVLLPDGFGIVLASRVINNRAINGITGPSALYFALDYFNKMHGRIYFLGASEETLLIIEKKIKKNYENIKVKTFSPPFSDEFTEKENREILKSVKEFDPDLLCVGMTAPKQEKWVYTNRDDLPGCYIMSIGAAFDWFSEVKRPPSNISMSLHLAWLERFFKEPIRMLPRIKSMFHFLYIIFTFKFKSLFRRW